MKQQTPSINRIYIVGPEGSGKSTLAKKISKKLNIKHYDLDDVVWSRRYDKKRNEKSRLNKLKIVLKKEKWIIEGIFGGWTEPVFKNADLVVILNLNYFLLIKNLLKRAITGKFSGFEKEKTNLKITLKTIKHVKLYKTRDHVKSYSGHISLIKKHKVKFIEINNKLQLNKLIKILN